MWDSFTVYPNAAYIALFFKRCCLREDGLKFFLKSSNKHRAKPVFFLDFKAGGGIIFIGFCGGFSQEQGD